MEANVEKEAFDLDDQYELIWDQNGQSYIVTDDKVVFTESGATIMAYNHQPIADVKNATSRKEFGIHNGHRFDGKNHNWLVFQGYLALGFSYMTFVI